MQSRQQSPNPQYTQQEEQTLQSNLLAMAKPVGEVIRIFEADARYLERRAAEGKGAFPDRTAPLWYFERDLIGVPFVFVTLPQFGTLTKSQFGPQEVARIGVSVIDLTGQAPRVIPPTIAQFSHRYLLNDLRGMTENELIGGHIWTLARNPDYPMTPQGKFPVTLKIYEFGLDRPELVDGDFQPPEDGFTPRTEYSTDQHTRPDPHVQRPGQTLPTPEQMDAARARFGLTPQPEPTPSGLGTSRAVEGTRPAWFQSNPPHEEPKRGRGRPRNPVS